MVVLGHKVGVQRIAPWVWKCEADSVTISLRGRPVQHRPPDDGVLHLVVEGVQVLAHSDGPGLSVHRHVAHAAGRCAAGVDHRLYLVQGRAAAARVVAGALVHGDAEAVGVAVVGHKADAVRGGTGAGIQAAVTTAGWCTGVTREASVWVHYGSWCWWSRWTLWWP